MKRLWLPLILSLYAVPFVFSGCQTVNSGAGVKESGTFELHFKQFEEEIFYTDLWNKCREKSGRPMSQEDFDSFDSSDILSDVSSENGYWLYNPDEPRSAIVNGDFTVADPNDKYSYVCVIIAERRRVNTGSLSPASENLRCKRVATNPPQYSVAIGTDAKSKYLDLVLKTKLLTVCESGLETRQKKLMCMPYDTSNGVHWQLFNIESRNRIGWAFGPDEKNLCLISIGKSSQYICAPKKQESGGYAIYDLDTQNEPRTRSKAPKYFSLHQECIQKLELD